MKKSGWKIILGVAVLVCVICLGRFGWVKYQDYKTEQARKATLKEIASTEFTGENEGKEPEKVPAGVKHGQKINFKKLIKINEAMPWLKAENMAPSMPFTFKSRDGLTLHGFITARPGGDPKPMIVMPHGGPHGPYDSWTYDSDAQFLASRGYAVLQVNFRGSGGRGKDFLESGYREWGGKMQDDIADGVKWAIDNKQADPARICTYGASYGGYAALMQTIRYPELYKCAIGYVGVYDLQVMKKEGDITDRNSGRRYLDRALGTDEALLRAWSPAQNVDKIKVPVFLAQGSIDKRVPMEQFNALKNAFKAAGVPIETMVAQGEGHGFYKPENRAELYKRMEAFLSRHIGAGAK